LRVQAFDPSDARRLAAELTDAGEALLNRLQTRARQDAIRVAAIEVERTRSLATAAQQALTSFRTRENMVDPTLLAQTVLNTITELSLHVVEASAQLDMLQHASGGSPQIAPLRSRVAALEAQIDRERATLAGSNLSYAPKIAEYERLTLLRDFAVRNFINALTALETARLEALHQRVYLERVVQPREADQPAYPHRVLCVLVVFGIGLLIYRILRPAAPVVPSLRAQFR
jgi:capsular polysaccharide transport system permease protein